MSTYNPFEEVLNDKIQIPSFPIKQRYTVSLSEEAAHNLTFILEKLRFPLGGPGLSHLLECIGLYAIDAVPTQLVVDEESGVTNYDCRRAGYEDAMEGNSQRFLELFKRPNTPFEQQYLRGYMEGSFVKSNLSSTRSSRRR